MLTAIMTLALLTAPSMALDSRPDGEGAWGSDDPNTSGGGGCAINYCLAEQLAADASCMLQTQYWQARFGPGVWCESWVVTCACYTSEVDGCTYCSSRAIYGPTGYYPGLAESCYTECMILSEAIIGSIPNEVWDLIQEALGL